MSERSEPAEHRIGTVDDLAEDGDRLITDVDGAEIAVFNIGGDYHAVRNFCVHQGGPLCEGRLRGTPVAGDDGWSWEYDDRQKYITCPWHGWKFDVTSGESLRASRYRIPTYEVVVRDGTIFVKR